MDAALAQCGGSWVAYLGQETRGERECDRHAFFHDGLHATRYFDARGAGGFVAGHQHSLDAENSTSQLVVCQTHHHSRGSLLVHPLVVEVRLAEILREGLCGHHGLFLVSVCFGDLTSDLSKDGLEVAFHGTDAALATVMLRHAFQSRLLEVDKMFVDTHVFSELWEEIPTSYRHLLVQHVPRQRYDLHSVLKRTWYGAHVVGGTNEENPRQITRYIEVVVVEGVVLLRVENFEES
mmetsp:Transcript_131513/g.195954  ORF Transcript_131513/g.195954 Transcript_131513/m.195954 type:complete len:236 (+) Transcript_131513:386-1093(+)